MTQSPLHSINVDEFIPSPASRIWKALTDPNELCEWFMATDFIPEVGHEFTLDAGNWGTTACTVIDVEPERLLRYTWKNPPLDTIVTWRIVPEGNGTRVFLEHYGFNLNDPDQRRAYNGMSGGWKSMILPGLVAQVTAGETGSGIPSDA